MKRINNINKLIGGKMGSYMNMIDDTLIKPTNFANLQEPYFQDLVSLYSKDLTTLRANVKDYMKDPSNVSYFNPEWNDTLAIEEMKKLVQELADNSLGRGVAWDMLKKAKDTRQWAINDEADWNTTIATARQRVDKAISKGVAGRPTLTNKDAIGNATQSIEFIKKWVNYQVVAEAYVSEINRRDKAVKAVNLAIETGDVAELEALKPKVKVGELERLIDKSIKNIKDREKSEKEAKAREEEARKKLAEAKTPEEKAQAQAELDALFNRGVEAVKSTFGGKTLLFVGIGLVVLIGGYFVLRKKD
jgi:hypothetical protein